MNAQLLVACRGDEIRKLAGRSESVGAMLLIEKEHLLPLAGDDFELAEVSFPRVDQAGCAKVLANSYSVPLKPGLIVEARAYSSLIEFRHDGERIAQHQRSYGRAQQVLDLEHYLEVLERKPGALRGSKPLAQWRAQGRWPASYDRLWEAMSLRHGRQGGTRAMVAVVGMGREFGYAKLEACVGQALKLGSTDIAAIRHLLMSDQLQHGAAESLEIGVLSAYERPLPTMSQYDQLLSSAVIEVQP